MMPPSETELGELRIGRNGSGFRILGPGSNHGVELPPDPDAIREWARFDEDGRYRPLPGARSLRPGLSVPCPDQESLSSVLDAVYPLAKRHQRLRAEGRLEVVPLDDVLARQTGRYEVAAQLSGEGRRAASEVLCGRCVRAPVWRGDMPADAGIPCPEPCSVLVSLCREAALWEEAPPRSFPVDPGVPFAQFEQPGNEIREAYLAARSGSDHEE